MLQQMAYILFCHKRHNENYCRYHTLSFRNIALTPTPFLSSYHWLLRKKSTRLSTGALTGGFNQYVAKSEHWDSNPRLAFTAHASSRPGRCSNSTGSSPVCTSWSRSWLSGRLLGGQGVTNHDGKLGLTRISVVPVYMLTNFKRTLSNISKFSQRICYSSFCSCLPCKESSSSEMPDSYGSQPDPTPTHQHNTA